MAVNETDVFKFGGTFKKICLITPSSKNSSQTSYFTIHARILQIRDKREDDYTTFQITSIDLSDQQLENNVNE